MHASVLAMWMPGPFEWAVIGGVALLVFGRRLPDVARSVGKSIVEFKRGLRDVKGEMDTQARMGSSTPSTLPNNSEPSNEPAQSAESSEKSSSTTQ